MTESKLELSAEKIQEAEHKFWTICDHISVFLHKGEGLNNWHACADNQKVGTANTYLAIKSKYPGMDENTWKEFQVTDGMVATHVKYLLKEHGLDTCEQTQGEKADKVYVFRKERK